MAEVESRGKLSVIMAGSRESKSKDQGQHTPFQTMLLSTFLLYIGPILVFTTSKYCHIMMVPSSLH